MLRTCQLTGDFKLHRLCLLTLSLSVVLGGATGTHTAEARTLSNYERAKRIIYATFPRDTEAAALRVVGCETGDTYSPSSYNSSGASGYFQILTGNHGRTFSYQGRRFRLNVWTGGRNQLFNPWYNAKAAYYMSSGGHDWDEWTCKP
jgi:Lysozyme like domain